MTQNRLRSKDCTTPEGGFQPPSAYMSRNLRDEALFNANLAAPKELRMTDIPFVWTFEETEAEISEDVEQIKQRHLNLDSFKGRKLRSDASRDRCLERFLESKKNQDLFYNPKAAFAFGPDIEAYRNSNDRCGRFFHLGNFLLHLTSGGNGGAGYDLYSIDQRARKYNLFASVGSSLENKPRGHRKGAALEYPTSIPTFANTFVKETGLLLTDAMLSGGMAPDNEYRSAIEKIYYKKCEQLRQLMTRAILSPDNSDLHKKVIENYSKFSKNSYTDYMASRLHQEKMAFKEERERLYQEMFRLSEADQMPDEIQVFKTTTDSHLANRNKTAYRRWSEAQKIDLSSSESKGDGRAMQEADEAMQRILEKLTRYQALAGTEDILYPELIDIPLLALAESNKRLQEAQAESIIDLAIAQAVAQAGEEKSNQFKIACNNVICLLQAGAMTTATQVRFKIEDENENSPQYKNLTRLAEIIDFHRSGNTSRLVKQHTYFSALRAALDLETNQLKQTTPGLAEIHALLSKKELFQGDQKTLERALRPTVLRESNEKRQALQELIDKQSEAHTTTLKEIKRIANRWHLWLHLKALFRHQASRQALREYQAIRKDLRQIEILQPKTAKPSALVSLSVLGKRKIVMPSSQNTGKHRKHLGPLQKNENPSSSFLGKRKRK